MEGFIFQIKNKYYFIETHYKKKTKTVAKQFLDYMLNKYKDCGFIPLHVVNNTFNKIYNNMLHATIKLSEDKTAYFIHTQDTGIATDANEVIIIERGDIVC